MSSMLLNYLWNVISSEQKIKKSTMRIAKRVFVTGTSRGLGKEFVKLVDQKHHNFQIHAAARQSLAEQSFSWDTGMPQNNVVCHQLDLMNSASIKNTVQTIKKNGLQLDYLIACGAFGCDMGQVLPSPQVAEKTLKTNVIGTIDYIKQFLPLLTDSARIVVVSSYIGSVKTQKPSIRKLIDDPSITEEKILEMSEEYIQAVRRKEIGDWHKSACRTSKALINAWTRFILPKYLKDKQSCIAMHPGWCKTDMGGPSATSSVQEGATRIYNAMMLQDIVPGKFYNEKWVDYATCQK